MKIELNLESDKHPEVEVKDTSDQWDSNRLKVLNKLIN